MSRTRSLRLAAVALFVMLAGPAFAEPPRIDPIFMDDMVLQAAKPLRITGEAGSGERVTVQLGGQQRSVAANADGRWAARFDPLSPGGPVALSAQTREGRDARSGVLAGDVWLCSGQSNMEWPVSSALNPANFLAGPFDDRLRLLTMSKRSAVEPLTQLAEGDVWLRTEAQSVEAFSGLCYFFAFEQRKTTSDPIGLINTSWGGSEIGAWIGRDALVDAGLMRERLDFLDSYIADRAEGFKRYAEAWQDWWSGQAGRYDRPWTLQGGEGWRSLTGPMRDWQDYGDPDLKGHLGMVWFRTRVTLSAAQATGFDRIDLGVMDEIDTVWINGQLIATSSGWGTPRSYEVPAGLLQAGENLIVVNVQNGWGQGGMLGPAADMQLAGGGLSGQSVGEGWQYRKVERRFGTPPRAPWFSIQGVTGLHNAMVAPLEPYAIKGAIWYQGESDTGRTDDYAGLLTALIGQWRGAFGADLPVLVVQLPEFGAPQSSAGESGWAGVREAQRKVAAGDPRVGLVVAMDAGTRFDIHPPDKLTLAGRSAQALASLLAGEEAQADGFAPCCATRTQEGVVLQWPVAADGSSIVTMGFHRPVGLQVCDRAGQCRFADAVLDGNRVILPMAADEAAAQVRYCWADVPLCNLYRPGWIPVTPFRIDLDAPE